LLGVDPDGKCGQWKDRSPTSFPHPSTGILNPPPRLKELAFMSQTASSNDVLTTDVVIVGAGPVGLFAVFECGMLKMRCHVVDALDMVGGQCTALYPEKPIYDIPAHPSIEAADLIDRLAEQAAPFSPTYHLGQQVEKLTRQENGRWLVETSIGTKIDTQAVVIAAGSGAFGPNRPPLDGLEAYEGKSVFYMVRRRQDFAGKKVVIAGGGDSAVDWAISLADVAERVYVVHRRPKFRAAPESVARMEALVREGRVEMVVPYQLSGLDGADGRLTAVRVATLDGEEKALPADALLAFFGLSMNLGPIADWGLDLERSHIAVAQPGCGTNVPGVFAIGDIATYPGKLKLILCGFAEAAQAAHAIRPLVYPGEALHFEYSTSKGVPGAA
jgi:thioredoxin reductase (NADPH)